MNFNFCKCDTRVVVPSMSDSPDTYLSILKSLKEPAFRDFLRVKISEKASLISKEIATKGKGSDVICLLAGEMEFCKYLLEGAVKEMEAILKAEDKSKVDSSVQTRFLSREIKGVNEEDQVSIDKL